MHMHMYVCMCMYMHVCGDHTRDAPALLSRRLFCTSLSLAVAAVAAMPAERWRDACDEGSAVATAHIGQRTRGRRSTDALEWRHRRALRWGYYRPRGQVRPQLTHERNERRDLLRRRHEFDDINGGEEVDTLPGVAAKLPSGIEVGMQLAGIDAAVQTVSGGTS